MAEQWVPVAEVARHLGLAKDTIYRWIETRGIPAYRVGRLWKFKLSEIDACIEGGGAGYEPRGGSPPARGGLT